MVKFNKTNLFASLMLLSALFVSCSNADNYVEPINDDPVPEQPSDDQPGDEQPGDDQPVETAYLECPDDNHPHMIDLGLPSGTKWACCNVGATTPEEYGDYFAWGETSPKDVYTEDTYRYYGDEGYINIGSDIAGTGHDAATVNWGAPWCTPSRVLCYELLENTSSVWTTQNGVKGRKFTGANGGTIFLPAAGYRYEGKVQNNGLVGIYWPSTSITSNPSYAYELYLDSSTADVVGSPRFIGHTVRPVR